MNRRHKAAHRLLRRATRRIFPLGLGLIFFWVSAETASPVTVEKILAVVNQEIIAFSDYKLYVSRISPGIETEEVDKELLKQLIEEKIILQEAQKLGIFAEDQEVDQRVSEFMRENSVTPDELQLRLREEGLSLDDYKKLIRENIISMKLIDYEVDSKIVVSDKEIEGYYLNNKGRFLREPGKVKAQAVFLKLGDNPTITELTDFKIRSLKVMQELRRGEPFEKVVVLFSDEPLRSRKGLLGEFAPGELVPEMEAALSPLKEQEISEPVWTREGVYILKLTARIDPVYSPLEEVKDTISRTLYEEKRQIKSNEWMKKLWEKSSISIK